jgi:hypothetical protein
VLWNQLLADEPLVDPYERTSVEDQVVDLLEDLLGAVRVPPAELVTSRRTPAGGRGRR